MEGDVDNSRTGETCEDLLDPENASTTSSSRRKHQKRKRPLMHRIWSYIKDALSGVVYGSKEPILEDLELPHRYRPENIQMLCDATGFSVVEMKRIYRGFKTECPTGIITEEAFHGIYSRFFPDGADLSSYSHYVFSTLDHEDNGVITFDDFVIGLSILLRGSLDDKLRWTFILYDQDKDGLISREDMKDVVGSIFDLMGRTADPLLEKEVISERVDTIFEKFDLNGDGVVSIDEFLQACKADETIYQSVDAFTNSAI